MQIVSDGDNLHERQILFFMENMKIFLIWHLVI